MDSSCTADVEALSLQERKEILESQHINIVSYLIENGADVMKTDERGRNAIFCACEKAAAYLVRYLVGVGADVFHKDPRGWTALHVTCDQAKFLGYFYRLWSSPEALANICNIVDFFVDLVLDLHAADENGHTPMIETVCSENGDVSQHLINKGYLEGKMQEALTKACFYNKLFL